MNGQQVESGLFNQGPDQQENQCCEKAIGAQADDPRSRIDQHHAEEQGHDEDRPQAVYHFLEQWHLQVIFQVQAEQLGAALQCGQLGWLNLAVGLGHRQHDVENGQCFNWRVG